MAALNANASYQQNQVSTVPPDQLLIMVYDGTLRFLAEGRRAMAGQHYDAQSLNLTKAQALIAELMVTLDHTAAPELAANLDRLYRYLFDRLTYANVRDDMQALDEVIRMVAELRETWVEAAKQLRRVETPAAAVGGKA